jgi:hypothetical protein
MKKVIIALMAALFLTVDMQAQDDMYYDIMVAGDYVTNENINNLSKLKYVKGGTITYSPSTKVLTLKNAVIDVTEVQAQGIVLGENGATVKLIGKNTVKSKYAALYIKANTTITGSGQLVLDGQEYGIRLINRFNRLIIKGGAMVKAKGGKIGIWTYEDNGRLGITDDGTKVLAYGNEGAICNFATIGIENAAEVVRPLGAEIAGGNVVDAQGNDVKGKWVLIKKKVTPTKTLTLSFSKRLINTDNLTEDQRLALDCLAQFNVLTSVTKSDPHFIIYRYQQNDLLALIEKNLTVYPNVTSANNVSYDLTDENHNAMDVTEDGVIPLEEYKTVKLLFNLSAPSQTKAITFTKRLHEKSEFNEEDLSIVEIMGMYGLLGPRTGPLNCTFIFNDKGKDLIAFPKQGDSFNVFPDVTSADNISLTLTLIHHQTFIDLLGYDPYADCNMLQMKFNVAKPNSTLKVAFPTGETPLSSSDSYMEKLVAAIMGLAYFGVLNPTVGMNNETYLQDKNGKTLFILAKDVTKITVPDNVTKADNFTWNITDEQHTRIITELTGIDPIGNYSTVNVCFGENNMVATSIPDLESNTDPHPDTSFYNLQGQRVEHPQKAGIYIHNGRKVIIR